MDAALKCEECGKYAGGATYCVHCLEMFKVDLRNAANAALQGGASMEHNSAAPDPRNTTATPTEMKPGITTTPETAAPKEKCKSGCMYPKDQPFPRPCAVCGTVETDPAAPKPAGVPTRVSITVPVTKPASVNKNPDAPPPILKHFSYTHLPKDLLEVSKLFSDLADNLVANIPAGFERSIALRKLLEAKDAAVRAKKFPGG